MYCPEDARIGANYDRNLETKQVAALLRAAFRTWKKAGEVPQNVTLRATSTWRHIDVRVIATNAADWRELRHNEGGNYPFPSFVPAAALQLLVDRVEGFLNSYIYDASDAQRDYFHYNFFASVNAEGNPRDCQTMAERRTWEHAYRCGWDDCFAAAMTIAAMEPGRQHAAMRFCETMHPDLAVLAVADIFPERVELAELTH